MDVEARIIVLSDHTTEIQYRTDDEPGWARRLGQVLKMTHGKVIGVRRLYDQAFFRRYVFVTVETKKAPGEGRLR